MAEEPVVAKDEYQFKQEDRFMLTHRQFSKDKHKNSFELFLKKPADFRFKDN